MSDVQAVPSVGTVRVAATGRVLHRCPHVDEVDDGIVTVAWTTAGATVELHSLAAHLASYADAAISHEELTDAIARAVAQPRLADIVVTTRFATAGLDVEVSSAVLRESLHPAGP